MMCYSQYLEEQQKATTSYHALTHPVRIIGEHATVEHKSSGVTIKSKYSLLDAAMREAQLESPVFFMSRCMLKNRLTLLFKSTDFLMNFNSLFLLT